MPSYTSTYSIPYPAPGDPIRGNVQDYIRTDIEDLAKATDAALSAVNAATLPQAIPSGTDWNTLTTVRTWSAPTSGRGYLNAPYENFIGSLFVTDTLNSTGNIQHQIAVAYNPVQMFVRERQTSAVWLR